MHKAILVSICVMGKQIFEQDVKMYVKFRVVKKKKRTDNSKRQVADRTSRLTWCRQHHGVRFVLVKIRVQ